MGTQRLTPSDSIQAAIDSPEAGPGGEIIMAPGTYAQQAIFRTGNPNNSGAFGNNLRIIMEPGVLWTSPGGERECARFQQNRYVTIEGEGTLRTPPSGRSWGAIHMFGDGNGSTPGARRTNIGHQFKGFTVERIANTDGIKHSEAVGILYEDLTIRATESAGDVEELIDLNKGALTTVNNCTFLGRADKAMAIKGGFVGCVINNASGNVSAKGIEIGGYPGSGEWAWLEQEFNGTIGADFKDDPWLEELASLLSTRYSSSLAFEWACRDVYVYNWDVTSSRSNIRHIGAWDTRINRRDPNKNYGPIPSFSTLFTSNRTSGSAGTSFFCHNNWIDGVREFDPISGRDTPTPFTAVPSPDGIVIDPPPDPDPDPPPPPPPPPDGEPTDPVLLNNTISMTVTV